VDLVVEQVTTVLDLQLAAVVLLVKDIKVVALLALAILHQSVIQLVVVVALAALVAAPTQHLEDLAVLV
jgi:hypothetical protein